MAGGLGQGRSCPVCLPPCLLPLPQPNTLGLIVVSDKTIYATRQPGQQPMHLTLPCKFTLAAVLPVVMRPSCLAQVDCGAMCMPGAAEKVQELIDDAVAKGAKVTLFH